MKFSGAVAMKMFGKWMLVGSAALALLGGVPQHTAEAQTTASSQTVVAGGLSNAAGVALDQFGNLYYTDSATGNVQQLPGANGSNTTLLSATLTSGSQLAVDTGMNVYAAAGNADVVYEYQFANGSINVNNPIALGNHLGTVSGVAVDLSGNVYAVDASNGQVVKISGGNQTVVLSGLVAPKQIAVDKLGGLYVADAGANAVVYLPAGGVAQNLGAGLNAPNGVAIDVNGNLYIADTGNGVVKEIPYSGGLSNANQITLPFTLSTPTGVAVDTWGTLYVAGGTSIYHLAFGNMYFGLVQLGQSSTYPVTITFSTAVAPASVQVLTTGVAGLDYVDAGGSTCAAGASYSAGSSCTVNVKFTPQFPGGRMGAIVFYDANNKVLSRTFLGAGGLGPLITTDVSPSPSVVSVQPVQPATLLYPNNAVTNPFPITLNQPHGGRFDAAENFFVADSNNSQVVEFPANATQPVIVAPGFSMQDVAINGAGDLVMPNLSAGSVVLVPFENGSWSVADAVTLGKGYSKPRTIYVDVMGNAYTCDSGNKKVYKLSVSGVQTQILTGVSVSPVGFAIDLYGNEAVTDAKTVWYAPVNGAAPYTVGSGYTSPWGLVFDAAGSLYVSDSSKSPDLRIPNENGTLSTAHQMKVGGTTNFSLAMDNYGNLVTFPYANSAPNGGWNMNFISRSGPSPFFAGTSVLAMGSTTPVVLSNSGNQSPVFANAPRLLGDIDDFTLNASVSTIPIFTTGFLPAQCNFSTTLAPSAVCYMGIQFSSTILQGTRTEWVQFPTQSPYTPQVYIHAAPTTGTPAGTQVANLSLSVSPSSPQPTQAITVSVSAGSGPTGAVTLLVDGVLTQTLELASGSARFSLPAGLPAGKHTLGVTYAGDATYAPITNPVTASVTITGATPTLSIASSAKDLVAGQSVTLTGAVVAAAGLPAPTGKITFLDGTTTLGTATLSNGVGLLTTSNLALGSHSISFSYAGDAVYAAGTSGAVTLTVGTYTPTSLALTVVPSQPSGGYSYGTKLTATAVVSAASGTPTGSVLFSLDGVVQNVTLTGTTATLSLTPSPGNHLLTASYMGDATFDSSASAVAFTTVKAATSTTLAVSATSYPAGSNVTLKAVVSAPGLQPTGTVVFRNRVAVIGAATLDSSGTASLTTYTLPAGTDVVTATYSGDANDQLSTSASIAVTPIANATTVTVSADPLIVLYANTPATTLTAAVTPTGASGVIAPMGGTVTFSANGQVIGTSPVQGGTASFAWSNTVPGTIYVITAAYSGDFYFQPSTQNTFRMYVAPTSGSYPGDYTVTMNPSPLKVSIGTPATATITVQSTNSYFGYVQITCANLPAYSDCEITPNQVVVDGTTTPQKVTLTVNAQASYQVARVRVRNSAVEFCGLVVAPLMSLLFLGSFRRGRRILRSGALRSLAAFLLLAAIGSMVSACGSHMPIATPPGTYTVNIVTTGTGGVNHVTPVQMTFQ